jgi:hypothetical protein
VPPAGSEGAGAAANLVEARQDAQRRVYGLRPEPLDEVDEWLGLYRDADDARSAHQRVHAALRLTSSGRFTLVVAAAVLLVC